MQKARITQDLGVLGMGTVMLKKGEVVQVKPFRRDKDAEPSENFFTIVKGPVTNVTIGRKYLEFLEDE